MNNFKIYDATDWQTNNDSTHITQYLKKQKQTDKETWSVNRIYHDHMCNRVTKLFPDHFPKSKLNISTDQRSEMLYKLLLLHVQVNVHQNLS